MDVGGQGVTIAHCIAAKRHPQLLLQMSFLAPPCQCEPLRKDQERIPKQVGSNVCQICPVRGKDVTRLDCLS